MAYTLRCRAARAAPGLLEDTRATDNLRSEQLERSAFISVLKQAAGVVVTMCRAETVTGHTIVIDPGARVSSHNRHVEHGTGRR
jgi:hypothetical protein